MKQMIEIDIPDGYEFDRFDLPKEGDLVIKQDGHVVMWPSYLLWNLCCIAETKVPIQNLLSVLMGFGVM